MTSPRMHAAQDYCEKHQLRLTDPRRFVLDIVSAADRPVGAYEILEKLGGCMANPKPPTAYRAIEFWQEHGFIHRIESLNAYVACKTDHRHEGSQFMICDGCGRVEETHLCHLPDALSNKASAQGFAVKHWSVELHGACRACSG